MANDNINPETTPEFVDRDQELETHIVDNPSQQVEIGASPAIADPASIEKGSSLYNIDRGSDDASFVAEAERIQQSAPSQDVSAPVEAVDSSFINNEPTTEQIVDNEQIYSEGSTEKEPAGSQDVQVTSDVFAPDESLAEPTLSTEETHLEASAPIDAAVTESEQEPSLVIQQEDSQGTPEEMLIPGETNLGTIEVLEPQEQFPFETASFDSVEPGLEVQNAEQEDPFADVLIEETPHVETHEDTPAAVENIFNDPAEFLEIDNEQEPAEPEIDSTVNNIEFPEAPVETQANNMDVTSDNPGEIAFAADTETPDNGAGEGQPSGQTDDSHNTMPENEQVEVSSAPVEIDRQENIEKAESALESHADAEVIPQVEFTEAVPDEASQAAIETRDGYEPQQRGNTDNEGYNPHDNTISSVIDHVQGISDQSIDSIYEDSAALAKDGEPYTMLDFQEDVNNTLEDCAKHIDSEDLTTSLPAEGVERVEEDMNRWIEDHLNDVDHDYNDTDTDSFFNDLDRNENTVDINEPDDDDDSYDPVDVDSAFGL